MVTKIEGGTWDTVTWAEYLEGKCGQADEARLFLRTIPRLKSALAIWRRAPKALQRQAVERAVNGRTPTGMFRSAARYYAAPIKCRCCFDNVMKLYMFPLPKKAAAR